MGRVNVRGIIAASFGVIIIVVLFIALFGNGWYYIKSKSHVERHSYYSDYEYDSEGGYHFGLSEVEAEYRSEDDDGDVDKDKESWDYDELEDFRHADDADDLFDIASLVFIFTLIGIIIAFGFVALGFLAGFRVIPGWIPLIVGIVASLCILFGPIYMIPATPDAWDKFVGDEFDDDDDDYDDYDDDESQDGPWNSFWGSDSDSRSDEDYESSSETSWGPGWCWYTAGALGVMLIAAAGMCGGIRRKKFERHGYAHPPHPGYGQPQRDPYEPPQPRTHDDLYGTPGPRRDIYDDPHGPPRRRDAYDDPYGPPPRRDAYDDPYGPPPRRAAYDDRDRHSSSSDNIPHTLTVFKCPGCGAAIMEAKCPYCGFIR